MEKDSPLYRDNKIEILEIDPTVLLPRFLSRASFWTLDI